MVASLGWIFSELRSVAILVGGIEFDSLQLDGYWLGSQQLEYQWSTLGKPATQRP